MKKSLFLAILLPILFIVLSTSCSSTPPQSESPPPVTEPAPAPVTSPPVTPPPVSEPVPPVPEPVTPPPPPVSEPAPVTETPAGPSQASIDALNNVNSRAEEARKRAIDFECPDYFPSDWEAVEARYADAGALPKSTDDEVQQAVASLNEVADTYDELFRKTISLYAQAREDEIIAARDELIATGLRASYPEYLRAADKNALRALSQYEAGDYYTARDTATNALYEYQALYAAARVYLTRQEILDRNFDLYDPDSFNKADDVAWSAVNEYEAGNIKAAKDYAEEALLRYSLLLAAGRAAYATNLRDAATAARQRALDVRANVAVRDFFREADAVYSRAETDLKAERYEEAAYLYSESEVRFIIARRDTEEKRRIAEEAIREAEEKIEASDESARLAEKEIEGGSL